MKQPSKEIEKQLHDQIPEFVHAVMQAKQGELIDGIVLMLDAFAGEPELLYNAIWYATSEGIRVNVLPSEV